MSEEHNKNLKRAYQMAGNDFLALKLERVFREIKTDEDRILHNDMVRELNNLIPDPPGFLKTMAQTINMSQINKNNLLKTISNLITESFYRKAKNG